MVTIQHVTKTISVMTLLTMGVASCSGGAFQGAAQPDEGTAEQPSEVTGAFLCGNMESRKVTVGAQTDETAIGCAAPKTSDNAAIDWKAFSTSDGRTQMGEAGDVRVTDDPMSEWSKVFVLPTIRVPEVMITATSNGNTLGTTWLKTYGGQMPGSFRLMGAPAYSNAVVWIPNGNTITGSISLDSNVNPENFCNYNGRPFLDQAGSPMMTQDPIKQLFQLGQGSRSYTNANQPVYLGEGRGCVTRWPGWSTLSKLGRSKTPREESEYLIVGKSAGEIPYCLIMRIRADVTGQQDAILAIPTSQAYGALKGTYLSVERLKEVLPQYVCE